jgi:hypothetical protein
MAPTLLFYGYDPFPVTGRRRWFIAGYENALTVPPTYFGVPRSFVDPIITAAAGSAIWVSRALVRHDAVGTAAGTVLGLSVFSKPNLGATIGVSAATTTYALVGGSTNMPVDWANGAWDASQNVLSMFPAAALDNIAFSIEGEFTTTAAQTDDPSGAIPVNISGIKRPFQWRA